MPFADFETEYFKKVRELLPEVQLYPGVAETLAKLHAEGYKLALVTAAITASKDVKRLQIGQYFDILVTAEDITRHKPDPEGVNLALRRLRVSPSQAVMVGDLPTDLKAAQAAGLGCTVGVAYGFSTHESLEAAGADYLIGSLAELPEILKKLPS